MSRNSVQLRRVARFAYGDSLASESRVDGEYPVVGSGGVFGTHNRRNFRAPGIVIGRKGSYGSVHWIESGGFAIGTAYYIDERMTSADIRWLYYVLQGVDLKGASQDVGVPGLSREAAYAVKVPGPPPLEEQRRIADFLDAETARIDKLAGAVERMQALTDERTKALRDDALGKLQQAVPLRYVVRFREGPGIMAADFADAGVPLIRIGGLQSGEVTLNGCNYLSPDKVASRWSHFRLKLGDRLISGSATMGEISVVRDESVVGAVPYTGLIILRPANPSVNMSFVESFLRSSNFMQQIEMLRTGAAMQHFGPTHLSQVKIPYPCQSEQQRIADVDREVIEQRERFQGLTARQLRLLAERRQALITAAVTGEFDVSAASGRGIEE